MIFPPDEMKSPRDQMIFPPEEMTSRRNQMIFSQELLIYQCLAPLALRAKGVEKSYSDVDLAVVAPEMDQGEFSRLLEDLESLDLVFKLDVLHLDQLNQPKLRDSIMAHGKTFYPCS